MGEVFDEAFPHYLVMGMTPEQYWDGESWLKVAYRRAYRIRNENEVRAQDRNQWMQGIYIRDALLSVPLLVNGFAPKGVSLTPYPDKPYIEKQDEEKKAEVRKRNEEDKMKLQMAMFQAMTEKFNKNLRKRLEKEAKAVTT